MTAILSLPLVLVLAIVGLAMLVIVACVLASAHSVTVRDASPKPIPEYVRLQREGKYHPPRPRIF